MYENNKQIIQVPFGIRYLSDWTDFDLNNFPDKCIINKQLPGCGFTEYCINCNYDLILTSPRKKLIKNKYDQHEKDVYLVIRENESDPGVDQDISIDKRLNDKSENLKEEFFINSENEINDFLEKLKYLNNSNIDSILENNIYKNLFFELKNYIYNRRTLKKPCKILVTYDSYRLVREILISLGELVNFKTVIDEFQSILHDARFKSNVELSFLEYLKQSPTAYFVSATPMIDEYINMLDEFNGLPYFELDWSTLDPGRIIKPNLKILTMRSTNEKVSGIIQKYLSGNFEKIICKDEKGEFKEIISDEAVFYVNSVKHIISIIKSTKLNPSQVSILCSETKDNKKKIQKNLGKDYLQCLSDIPLRGEKPKMFTFCTRTVYLGADFYSTCARTFIFSDSNLDCLAVDISDDLPQILGRQRLDENPWKNSATFYYKCTSDWNGMSEEDFKKEIEKKNRKSLELLNLYSTISDKSTAITLAETCESAVKADNYKRNYVAVNRIRKGNKTFDLQLVFNKLVYVNEIRAFRIAQIDYKDRFSVFAGIKNKFGRFSNREDEFIVSEFLNKYDSETTILGKYRLLCENDFSEDTINFILSQLSDSDPIKYSYLALGPVKLKSMSYKKSLIEIEMKKLMFDKNKIAEEIFKRFEIGSILTMPDIKEKIINIYSDINYSNKVGKAVDLLEYFNVKDTFTKVIDKQSGLFKKAKVYILLSPKEEFRELYNKIKGI